MLSRAMRHRLGLTVAGVSSPSMKAYSPRFHSTVPLPARTTPSGTGAIRPRLVASKSAVSANGSLAAIVAFAVRVAASASRASSRCVAGTGTAEPVAICLPLTHPRQRRGEPQAYTPHHPTRGAVLPRRRGRHVLWNARLQAQEEAAGAAAPGRQVAGSQGWRRHARSSAAGRSRHLLHHRTLSRLPLRAGASRPAERRRPAQALRESDRLPLGRFSKFSPGENASDADGARLQSLFSKFSPSPQDHANSGMRATSLRSDD